MPSKVLIWLCAFACCMQLSLQEWAIDDTGCITPDNAVGDCVDVYECAPIIDLLDLHVKRRKVVSERLKTTLGKYVCGIGKITKVCCPRVTKIATTPDVTPTPIVNPVPTLTPRDVTPTPDPISTPDVTPTPVVNPGPTLTPLDVTPTPIVTPEPTPDLVVIDTTNPQISGRNLLPMDSCGLFESQNKVFGGEPANLFEFPWMALLAYESQTGIQYLCGGTLINDRYVLTAAHCITNLSNLTLAYIRLGEYDLRNATDCETPPGGGDTVCADPTEDLLAEEVILHPEFDFTSFRNDIGLIRLQKNIVRKDHISPICLPIEPELRIETLRNVVLTGWGLTGTSGPSDVLMKVEVSMMDLTECRRIYRRSNVEVTDNHMCVGGIGRKGSCPGDSGGPVQLIQAHNTDVRYVQHGILSLGPSICGGLGLPGIHTRVDRYLDWIINTIKP